ncbi:MAG: DUF3307 domain-containing protein [Methanobrevibacter sp.]|jgi:hypothetical protein|nr:DUF3307 domain-containing protein [Candidatus Methanoflexus mossambicus]
MNLFTFYFFSFLLCHFIGDFYLQSEKMVRKKEGSFKKIAIHSVLYVIPFLILFFLSLFWDALPAFDFLQFSIFIIILIISHFVIDSAKNQSQIRAVVLKLWILISSIFLFEKKISKKWAYIMDQLLHVGILFIFSFWLSINSYFSVNIITDIFFGLKVVLFIIIIHQPVNVTFKKLFSKYQPEKKDPRNGKEPILGAGSTIGTLERLLMGIFVSIGQFSAIGLIMAAKSIARYDQISQNPQFAEYYLIGTLYSVLITIIIYGILFIL